MSYSLYVGNWFSAGVSYKKQILFTMTRLQKPVYVTIGKVTPLNFHTFLTVKFLLYNYYL